MVSFAHSSLLVLAVFSGLILAKTGLLVPLYGPPGFPSLCAGWSRVMWEKQNIKDIVPFYTIINPAGDGPGVPNSQPVYPYPICIPQLRDADEAQSTIVMGYVATTGRSSSDILADLTTYAGWNDTYHVDGVFFDGITATAELLPTNAALVQQAKTLFGEDSFIMLNASGPPEIPDYYTLPVNQIITLETAYANFSQSLLTLDEQHPPSKQAIILHDAPNAAPDLAFLRQLVLQDKLGSLYWTDLPFDQLYDQFVDLAVGLKYCDSLA